MQLSVLEKATLIALAEACNYSLAAHVPEQAITCKFPKHLRGDVKKTLKNLRKERLCSWHPTGKNMTWQLSRSGLDEASKII